MSWVINNEGGEMLAVSERGQFTWTPKETDALQFSNRASAAAITGIPVTPVQAWRSIQELP